MPLDFQPLSLTQQDNYRQLLQETPQKASDYSFINLWTWQEEYGLEWAFEHGLVWIRQTKPSSVLWAPVGPWHEINWRNFFQQNDLERYRFTRVPQDLLDIWQQQDPQKISFQEAPEQWDYLYSVAELINLSGNRFHKKKNLLKQFTRKYSFNYLPLSSEETERALTLQTEWCLWRDCEDSTTLQAENKAILRAFQDWNSLKNVLGGGLEIEGNMVAFTIAEPLDTENIVIHFEKACPQYKGSYQAINQLFLKNSAAAYTYVNREQDLGDPGLRKAKKSYNPYGYLQKYIVDILNL
jgi:hypothetical protein